ncbi:MAG TPA: hypothetical protein VEQ60_22495 [Longimicrobium sp.]|nr:hypothetical protein [Longimicrobium sp.]
MSEDEVLSHFRARRLQGEAVPPDVTILLAHHRELSQRIGVQLNWDEGWAPWLDTRHLRQEELEDRQVAANIRAGAEICGHIAFIAAHEDGEYYGYWRGVEDRPVSSSPLVRLDNEGQFRLCGGNTFAEALLERTYDEEDFDELKDWLVSLGIPIEAQTIEDLADPAVARNPRHLHEELYRQYLG